MKEFIGYIQSALYQSPYSDKILGNPEEHDPRRQNWLHKQEFIELQKSTANNMLQNLEEICAPQEKKPAMK